MDKLKQKHIEHWKEKLQSKSKFIYKEDNIFHDYFRQIPFAKLKHFLDKNNIDLNDKTVLIAGCGKGTDVYYLSKFYKFRAYMSDIAEKVVKATNVSFENTQGVVADTENLPFNDNSFDYCFIANSLHHLPKPILGLYELLRVAKDGVIVIEPNDSILTTIATSLGSAQERKKLAIMYIDLAKEM